MKKILLFAAATLLSAQGAWAGCASSGELQSLGMRALQSELMVAALACGKKQDYNNYIGLFSQDLQWQGQQLKGYFSRNYGSQSERELNTFVTQMANQASRVSLNKSSQQYCSHASDLFNKVNTAFPWQIIDYARKEYSTWHNVLPCSGKQVVAAVQ